MTPCGGPLNEFGYSVFRLLLEGDSNTPFLCTTYLTRAWQLRGKLVSLRRESYADGAIKPRHVSFSLMQCWQLSRALRFYRHISILCNFSWFLSVNWFKFCNTRVEIAIRPEDCHGFITHTLHMIMLFCLLKLVWGERWLCPFFLFNFLICAYLFANNGSDCISEIKLLSGSIYEI